MTTPRWGERAACAGYPTEWWYPNNEKPTPGNLQARELCRNCPVKTACANHAIALEAFGTWGGLSERARRRIRETKRIRLPEGDYGGRRRTRRQRHHQHPTLNEPHQETA